MKQRVFRLPKSKKITVSDLLGQNEINGVINDVIKEKATVQGILVITQDHDGRIAWKVAGFTGLEVVGILEQVKAWECEDDEYDC